MPTKNAFTTTMNIVEPVPGFEERIESQSRDSELAQLTLDWMVKSGSHNYGYNFTYFGRPIIQLPQDIMAMQELIWKVNPDLIIETGIARGGSLIFSASMLAMLEYMQASSAGEKLDPRSPGRLVLGVDLDIRAHNRVALEAHPLAPHIRMLEGSSIDPRIIDTVHDIAKNHSRVLVCLDSMHTHDHVLSELQAYGQLVSKDSYCVVFDTLIEDLPPELNDNRPWGEGNNPKTAIREFLKTHSEFEIDTSIANKLLITACPDGFLKRVE